MIPLALPLAFLMGTTPCDVDTSTTTSLRPQTQLERIYYRTAVCYRRKWMDAESDADAARKERDAANNILPPPASPPADSAPSGLLLVIGATAVFLLGAALGHFVH